MKWIVIKPKKEEKIREQTIRLLQDKSITPIILVGNKKNDDGSDSPVFLLSRNFRDPHFFIEEFTRLMAEQHKLNLVENPDIDEE